MVYERSAMALVFYQDKILVTHEIIYGSLKISLPKGHIETGESIIDAAIRETFEECDIELAIEDYFQTLMPFKINFTNHLDEAVEKEVYPVIFIINEYAHPMTKEKQILKVEYMDILDFLNYCSYDNVKEIVKEAYYLIRK